MAIPPICASCKEEIFNYAALLLGPPTRESMVKKDHLCGKCYNKVIDSINAKNTCGTVGCNYHSGEYNQCTFVIANAYGSSLIYDNTQCNEYTIVMSKEEKLWQRM